MSKSLILRENRKRRSLKNETNEDIPEKKIIINNIKKIRGKLIKDSSASVRVRGACLLSYFGFDFTVKILNKMNKHKYI